MTSAWDPLIPHDDDDGAHIAGKPTDFTPLAAKDLYQQVLVKIKGDAVTGAITYWSDAAVYLGGSPDTPGGLIQALTDKLKPLTNGHWVGEAADQFHKATDTLMAFAKQLCETIRYIEDVYTGDGVVPSPGVIPATVYASFHSVSERLAEWMQFVAQELPASPYTNGGNSWSDASVDQSKVDQFDFSNANGQWMQFQGSNHQVLKMPTYRTYYAGRGGAARAPAGDVTTTADGWTQFLNNTSPNHPYVLDPDAVRGFIYTIRRRFLNVQQLAFFQELANGTADCYRYYYPYVPRPPTWNGWGSDSGNGTGPTSMPPFGPINSGSIGGLSGLDIPSSLTGTGLTDPGLPADGSLITNPDGPTSLAGFTPTTFDPGALMTPLGGLGGLGGYGGGLSSGLDGLGVGAGGLGTGGLAAGGLNQLSGEEAAAALGATAARPGMGMYPPMMGGAGAQKQDQERPPASYLVEDEQFWAVEPDRPPSVIGGDE